MPGRRYPRPWCRLDREFLSQDTIRELGECFGSDGPLVFLALVLEAGKTPPGGQVTMRWSALGRLAFVSPERAQEIVRGVVDVGLLDDLEADERRFAGRLTRWENWEAKDPSAAQRQANHRAVTNHEDHAA